MNTKGHIIINAVNQTSDKPKNKKQPSLRARKALEIMSENGGNMGKAMLEAGYSEITSKTPQKLTGSKGFKELMEEKLNDELLSRVHSEGLEAYRTVVTEDGEAEIPDFAVRHKYLETAYKIRDKMPKESNLTAVQVNVGQTTILPEVLAEADKILRERLLSRKPNEENKTI